MSLKISGIKNFVQYKLHEYKNPEIIKNKLTLDNQLTYNDWNISNLQLFTSTVPPFINNYVELRNYLQTEDLHIKIKLKDVLDLSKIKIVGNVLYIECCSEIDNNIPYKLINKHSNTQSSFTNIKIELILSEKTRKKTCSFFTKLYQFYNELNVNTTSLE